MEIRLLGPFDAKAYWSLRLEALKQNPEAFATSYEEAKQRENPIDQVASNLQAQGSFTFGAFENGELIGVVTLLQVSTKKLSHTANILAMYVKPKMRGSGVGKALVSESINKARSIKGVIKLNLSVVTSNEKAKILYSQLGFETFGVEERALCVNGIFYDEQHMYLFI